MRNIDIDKLKEIIQNISRQELLTRFNKVAHSFKSDGSMVTAADVASQQQISIALKQYWPEFGLIGEEMTTQQQVDLLASDQAVWCLDPLDGTSNFAAGIPYFAISLSLIQRHEVVLGIVYDPIRNECFHALKSKDGNLSCFLNNQSLVLRKTDVGLCNATAIVDFKRLSNDLASRIVVERPFSSQRNFGASALDWCWLAAGRGHVYLHGSQNLWDYSAGELIFRSAGGFSATFEGETVFRRAIQKRSIVAAMNHSLFTEWQAWLKMPISV